MASIINKEKLLSGIIFGDTDNNEYIYMPGGEISSSTPICVLEKKEIRTDISLEEAVSLINQLHLKPLNLLPFNKI